MIRSGAEGSTGAAEGGDQANDQTRGRIEPMNDATYITCQELMHLALDYIDGPLTSSQRHAFEQHLVRCPSCVVYLEGYRKSLELQRAPLEHRRDRSTARTAATGEIRFDVKKN